ncbi:MAG TPA: DUF1844 domain-containing protein [Deltaproteobacteria bacterium]|nr:DUF1844 domain-containing protein [Deltaproteobacteria bacterium]
MSEETKDFVIKDRRIFGQEEAKKEEKEEKQEKAESSEAQKPPQQEEAAPETEEEITPLPEIDFQTFVFSLNASALVQLGVMDDPATGRKEKNLLLAKQTIDILSMLQEKTTGNLSGDEDNLLKNILYDLRIRYVKEKR